VNEEIPGTAVRVTPSRQRADEWAVVLAAAGTPHWLRRRLDGWVVIVPPDDALSGPGESRRLRPGELQRGHFGFLLGSDWHAT